MKTLRPHDRPLNWCAAGIILAVIQIIAIGLFRPLAVSDQFIVADTEIADRLTGETTEDEASWWSAPLQKISPLHNDNLPIVSEPDYERFGYDFYFVIGIAAGALLAAIVLRRWKLRTTTDWSRVNQKRPLPARLLTAFSGGFLLLFGASMAHGALTGQLAGGWAQLSLSAVPFTVAMLVFAIFTASLFYPTDPSDERGDHDD